MSTDPRILVEKSDLQGLKALTIELSKVRVNLDDNLLHIAAYFGADKDVISYLLEKNVDPNGQNKHGILPLTYALERDNIDAALQLLPHTSVSLVDDQKRNVVHRALEYRRDAIVDNLLQNKDVLLDAKDINGDTYLIMAAKTAAAEIIDLLLKLKVNLDVRNNRGRNALMESLSSKDIKLYKKLLSKYDKVESIVDSDNNNLLHLIASLGDDYVDFLRETIKKSKSLLKKTKFSLSSKNKDGDTPLTLASKNATSSKLMIEKLLKHMTKDEISLSNLEGKSAKELAITSGLTDLPKKLIV